MRMAFVGTFARTNSCTTMPYPNQVLYAASCLTGTTESSTKKVSESMGNVTSRFVRVFSLADLQGSFDALGLYRHPETRGAAAHLDRDPNHLPTPSFWAKIVIIPTYLLYFTAFTVSSEIKPARENYGDVARR